MTAHLRRGALLLCTVLTALIVASPAFAVDWFTGWVAPNNWRFSGWNYWAAAELNKSAWSESVLYFNNQNKVAGTYNDVGYHYIDEAIVQVWGYKRAEMSNVDTVSIWYDANICTC